MVKSRFVVFQPNELSMSDRPYTSVSIPVIVGKRFHSLGSTRRFREAIREFYLEEYAHLKKRATQPRSEIATLISRIQADLVGWFRFYEMRPKNDSFVEMTDRCFIRKKITHTLNEQFKHYRMACACKLQRMWRSFQEKRATIMGAMQRVYEHDEKSRNYGVTEDRIGVDHTVEAEKKEEVMMLATPETVEEIMNRLNAVNAEKAALENKLRLLRETRRSVCGANDVLERPQFNRTIALKRKVSPSPLERNTAKRSLASEPNERSETKLHPWPLSPMPEAQESPISHQPLFVHHDAATELVEMDGGEALLGALFTEDELQRFQLEAEDELATHAPEDHDVLRFGRFPCATGEFEGLGTAQVDSLFQDILLEHDQGEDRAMLKKAPCPADMDCGFDLRAGVDDRLL